MLKEEGLFTIGEDDNEKELFVVAEEGHPDEDNQDPINPDQYEEDREDDYTPIDPPSEEPPSSLPSDEKVNEGWRSTKDVKQFTQFLADELNRIGEPRKWRTRTEKERGVGQLKRLNNFISQALREDFDSILNIDTIDKTRNKIEQHIDECEHALDSINYMKKQRKRMRRRADENPELVKEAGVPHMDGMVVAITPFERAIAGALINGVVSGGRNMNELYKDAKEKYDLTPREELSIFQIITDMGFPTFADRLRIGENQDPTRTSGFGEWNSTYYA